MRSRQPRPWLVRGEEDLGGDTERLIETHDVHDLELVLQAVHDRKVWVLADIGSPTVPFA